MERIVYFLEELASLDMDDDGDIVLFNEFNWAEQIKEMLELAREIQRRSKMKIYDQWQCPSCERIDQVDVDDYLEIGTPMCTECGGAVEMERLSERIAIEGGSANYL